MTMILKVDNIQDSTLPIGVISKLASGKRFIWCCFFWAAINASYRKEFKVQTTKKLFFVLYLMLYVLVSLPIYHNKGEERRLFFQLGFDGPFYFFDR